MPSLSLDLRYAVRRLTREPGFAATAILILAVGIGGCTAMFSIVQAVLLRPLGVESPNRVVMVWTRSTQHSAVGELSYRTYRELRARTRAFDNVAILGSVNWSGTMSIGSGEPIPRPCSVVSATFFDVLGTRSLLGRTFRAADDEPFAPRVLILSHPIWKQYFGGDPNVIGRSVTVREEGSPEPFEIVGVMPADFFFPRGAAYWTPAGPRLARIAGRTRQPIELLFNGLNVFYGLGRLPPDRPIARAGVETTLLLEQVAKDLKGEEANTHIVLTPILDHIFGRARPALVALMAAVIVVLLVACINVAGLLFVRGASRTREMAVRAALGADRRTLMRQLMAESALVTLAATVVGVGVAAVTLKTLVALSPADIPRLDGTALDVRVLAFAIAIAVATTFLVGLVPAAHVSRPSVADELKGSASGVAHRSGRSRAEHILIAAQVAATLVLVMAAGLCVNSFSRLAGLNLGFDPRNVLTFQIRGLDGSRYPSPSMRNDAIEDVLSRFERLPHVVAAGGVFQRPFEHGPIGLDSGLLLEGQVDSPESRARNPTLNYESVTSGYFRSMGIRLVRGRSFDIRDNETSPPVVIVSEAMAARVWPGEDPIGKRIRTSNAAVAGDPAPWQTVIGVVATARYREIDSPRFELYVPFRQAVPIIQHFTIRTAIDPLLVVPTIAAEVASSDRALSVDGVTTMERIVRRARGPWQFNMLMFSMFGGVALVLAAVGLFALVAYEVTERRREIGLRMALGAARGSVVRLMIVQGTKPAAVGLAIGVVVSLLTTRMLSGLLFEVSPRDPVTFAGVLVFLISVVLLASYVPARRAASVDPQVVLRDA